MWWAEAPAPEDGLFRRAAVAQGPLLDAERLVGSAFGELLIAAAGADPRPGAPGPRRLRAHPRISSRR